MRALRSRVIEHDVTRWSKDFLEALAEARPSRSAQELVAGSD